MVETGRGRNEERESENGDEREERKKVEQEEEEEEISIERIFEKEEVPSWKKQLTLRAFVVSFVLSVLFCFIVMKLNLTTGIIPSLNVSAGLLGFFFVKTWTKIIANSGMLRQPFTRQENTVIQTCVVASSGIAFSGIIPSLNSSSYCIMETCNGNLVFVSFLPTIAKSLSCPTNSLLFCS